MAEEEEDLEDDASPSDELLREIAAFDRSAPPARKDDRFEGNDRFEVVKRIGSGGFGTVYEVVDREEGERVALKTLARADRRTIARFKREFRAIADLEHPHLVRLRELFFDRRWFFTMDLVAGVDFLDFARPNNALDEAKLRSAFGALASALDTLHARGMVHRDVKPSNALVDAKGRLVLLDFGLVARADDRDAQSLDFIAGTPLFMAPEQMLATPVTPAADWYSAGVLLHYAMTGAPPRTSRGRDGAREATAKIDEHAPRDLADLCARLLAHDPKTRASADDVRAIVPFDRAEVEAPAARGLDRSAELESLFDMWDAARGRRGCAAIVTSKDGGAREVVRAFAAKAKERVPGALVLTSRARERERIPLRAMDEATLQLAKQASQRTDDATKRAIAKLDAAGDDAAEQFDATRELFAAMARARPIVVAIEDGEHGDAESAELVAWITSSPRVFVVAAVDARAPGAFVATLDRLAKDRRAEIARVDVRGASLAARALRLFTGGR